MKKYIAFLISMLLLFSILPTFSVAKESVDDIDLSQLSITDLVDLEVKVKREIEARCYGSPVVVPPGVYKAGIDVPSGQWDISLLDLDNGYVAIDYCMALDVTQTTYKSGTRLAAINLTPKQPMWSINLRQGDYIIIRHDSVVFSKHVSPSLGFGGF